MSILCITFRFIQPFPVFHGSSDAGVPEWPPSPMRAFQALVNATSLKHRGKALPDEIESALALVETIRPSILASKAMASIVGYRAYVPHNQTDLVTAAWDRGDLDASVASHRGEKDFRPIQIPISDEAMPSVHYLYPLEASVAECERLVSCIRPCVRSISALGWGIDQVAADAVLLTEKHARDLSGDHWQPVAAGGNRIRVSCRGSLRALRERHDRFLARVLDNKFTPVPPLSTFDLVRYAREGDPLPRPHVVFKLLDENGDTYRYPHSRLIHIAGMVRHLAIKAMEHSPPPSVSDPRSWVDQYIAGHRDSTAKAVGLPHAQLSYVPLPSIGHPHTDPGVRREMIVAPVGDDTILEHVCSYLDGLRLEPERSEDLRAPVFLHRVRNDNVADRYTRPSNSWASFTPVIVPGHDDHKHDKRRKLIEKALLQSGIDQPCEYEWSAFSHFGNSSYSAHKYDRSKRLTGFVRPDYLISNAAVHLQIRFGRREDPKDPNSRWIAASPPIPGPITIGAGRHCGFGLMAASD
jgi:CRISPR-associated protein Csb2